MDEPIKLLVISPGAIGTPANTPSSPSSYPQTGFTTILTDLPKLIPKQLGRSISCFFPCRYNQKICTGWVRYEDLGKKYKASSFIQLCPVSTLSDNLGGSGAAEQFLSLVGEKRCIHVSHPVVWSAAAVRKSSPQGLQTSQAFCPPRQKTHFNSAGGNPDEARLGRSLWGLGFKHHKLSRPKTSIDGFAVELFAHRTKYPVVLHWGHVFSYSRVFARKWELVSLKCDSQMALDCSDCSTRWLAEVHLRQRTVMCI